MGGVRNGKSAGAPEPPAARQDAPRTGVPDVGPEEDAQDAVGRHLRSAMRLLREGSAARAFGELARATRTQPLTPRLAAALVRYALLAGTEAAAITLLDAATSPTGEVRRAVRRQLARVLRRVGQVPRAIAALEAVLVEFPEDRRAQRGIQLLRRRLEGPEGKAPGDARGATEAAARNGEPSGGASAVLAKLPTRKAGVQAAAVWDEDSDYREETLVESGAGVPAEPSSPEPREKTAVAFPAEAAEPREKTAVAFPAEAAEPREKTAVAFPSLPPAQDVPWGEPGGKQRPQAASEAAPSEARPTVVEMPAVGAASSSPPPEARPTVVEMPAVGVASSTPRPEPAKTAVGMPAVGVVSTSPRSEPARTEVELPAVGAASGPVSPQPRSGPGVKQENLSVPWPELSTEGALPPLAPAPRGTQVRPPREGAWDADEDTGEVTSEAQPPLLGGYVAETPPPAESAPRPVRGDAKAALPAATASEKDRPDSTTAPRSETQEVPLADLVAALGGAAVPGASSRTEPPRPGVPAAPGTASAASAEASTAVPGRAPGGRAEPTPAEAEELARSQKLEAQLIARQAWRELAQLYLKRADRAKDPAVRAEALTRLAEVMETELQDPAGAARMYREIVELTGDRAALREQVRLLSARGDASLVRRALDEAIQRARTARARAGALLTRGERWLHMGEPGKARSDFEAADALSPGLLPVLAGLLHCVTDAERPAAAERLQVALSAAPRRAPDRVEGLRALARAAEDPLGDLRMAQWAWTEVLAESPESEQARGQLVTLARRLGDPKALGQLLRAQLARESRGPAARQARLELVSTLEALGDTESALNELRQAVRYEPGHKEAWLLLVERLTAVGNMGEAAWALEHGATAMEDELEREQAWERLARLWRDVLRNPERAQVYARRAEGLRQAREEREAPLPPEPPRSATPRREPSGPQSPLVPAPSTLSLTPSGIEALANETTSTTDPGAPAATLEAPAVGKEGAVEKARKGDERPAPRDGAAQGAVPAPGLPEARGEKPSNRPAQSAGVRSERALGPSASEAPGASAATSRQAQKAPAPASPAAGAGASAPASHSARTERLPSVAGVIAPEPKAPAARDEKRSSVAGVTAPEPKAPAARDEHRPAVPGATAPEPRAAARADKRPSVSGVTAPEPKAPVRDDKRSSLSGTPAPEPKAPARDDKRTAVLGVSAPEPKAPAREDKRTAVPSVSAPDLKSPARDDKRPAAPGVSAPEPKAPAARAEKRPPGAGATAPEPKAPAAQRGAAPRDEKPAPAPRGRQAVSDGEPSVASTRPLAASARASQGRAGAGEAEAPARSPSGMDLMAGQEADMELGSAPVADTRVISWEAPPGRFEPGRRLFRSRQEGTAAPAPAPAPAKPAGVKPPEPPARAAPGASETREAPAVSDPSPDTEPNAFRYLREHPLEAATYRELSEYFDGRGDAARASLMREISDALQGKETPAQRHQRPPLTTEERAGLRHPGLRTPSGELLALTGIALCRLFPAQGRAAGTSEPLRASSGPGAPAVLDALHTAARLLDVNLPELVLAEDDGPPFTAVHAGNARLLVGRLALRQPPAAAELRFHAGRALLSLSPDLLALRALKGGQLLRALALLSTVLKDPRASGPEARVVRDSLSPRALERAIVLLEPGTRDFDASALADAARDSANRAGLVASGSVGPALAVLRARRNQDAELVELLRFAASERYLELRAPR
ncbi:hypothetical protein [Pyxidicoccus xibeiensis]|uniref:hypothetical protein n=1 Tax=Pyxidicoccus xibeiensis TaxID=2906759 RepID=UPI002113FFE4|nr:hypothetical protein [Pyxidicoccus xibeiensis]